MSTVTVTHSSINIDDIISQNKLDYMKKKIGEQMLKDVKSNFNRQSSPDGRPWAPLKYRNGKALVKTGKFLNSLKLQIDGDVIKVGTDHTVNGVLTPAVHQFGATIRPKKGLWLWFKIGNKLVRAKQVTIPARPFLGITQSMLEKYAEIVRKIINV